MSTTQGVRYRVVVDVAAKGSPRRQVTRTVGTLAEARAFVNTTRAGLSSGTFTAPSAETVEQLCTRWLESRRDIRLVTVQGYANVLAPVLRHIGSRKVQGLTVGDIEALTAWLSR